MNHPKSMFQLSGVHYRGLGALTLRSPELGGGGAFECYRGLGALTLRSPELGGGGV